MDNTLLIGLNGQQILRRRLDVVANNIANMNTAAFKMETVLNEKISERPARASDTPGDIRFANAWGLQRDMRSGALERTGNSLDLALEEANAFFSVQVGEGTFYTRDGQFALDELARLVTHEGALVLDDAGREIVFDPDGGQAQITKDGAIRQGDVDIGRLGIFSFETPAALAKTGNNQWQPNGQEPTATEAPRVQQGFVEQSNVNAIAEITRMIEISKAYESTSRMLKNADDLRKNAISKLGSVQ